MLPRNSDHIWDLLDSDSKSEFAQKHHDMQNQWSGQFKLYFERHIKESILKSGKWVLLKNDIYTERSGITINPSESYNAVLKRFLEKKR